MHDRHMQVLRGANDPSNPLSALHRHVLMGILKDDTSWYEAHLDRTSTAFLAGRGASYQGTCAFPEPTGINVNMMPIRLFDRSTYPSFILPYEDMIRSCLVSSWDYTNVKEPSLYERVAYLTIDESPVPAGRSHRRPGLHVERPAVTSGRHVPYEAVNGPHGTEPFSEYKSLAWGMGGCLDGLPVDGIFMASNVADSCKVWPVTVVDPEEVTDAHGGIEHMRDFIGAGRALGAGEMCWITDRTPHESLPHDRDAHRQFFRLVVGRISVWYSRHNAPNPLGVQPDAPVSDADKFAIYPV